MLVHLTAASNNLLKLPLRADRLTHVRPVVISNISVVSGMGQAATGCNFKLRQQKSCQCARSRIKQCSSSRQHN